MSISLFDRIRTAVLDVQTAIEFSTPVINLSTSVDEACNRVAGSNVNKKKTSSYNEPTTKEEPKKEADKKQEPKKESAAKQPKKQEVKNDAPPAKKEIPSAQPTVVTNEAKVVKKEEVVVEKVNPKDVPEVTPIDEQRRVEKMQDIVTEFIDGIMEMLKDAAKDMSNGDKNAEEQLIKQMTEGFKGMEEDEIKYIIKKADEKKDFVDVEAKEIPTVSTTKSETVVVTPPPAESQKKVASDRPIKVGVDFDPNEFNQVFSQPESVQPVGYYQPPAPYPVQGIGFGPIPNVPQEPQVIPNPNPGAPDRKPKPVERRPGEFAVDAPPRVRMPKADPDPVTADLDIGPIELKEKPVKVSPPSVDSIVASIPEPEPTKPRFDNSEITTAFPYMKQIEDIALQYNMHLYMTKGFNQMGQFDRLIKVQVFDDIKDICFERKCFTIDTGTIINGHKKFFPVILQYGYEQYPCYPVFMDNKDWKKNGRGPRQEKSDTTKVPRKVLNESLFDKWFGGGEKALDRDKPMITDEKRFLNACIALITLNAKGLKADQKRKLHLTMREFLRLGVFERARQIDPRARFRFIAESYNHTAHTFTLSSERVPTFYDGPVESTVPIEIKYFPATRKNNAYVTFIYGDKNNPTVENMEIDVDIKRYENSK